MIDSFNNEEVGMVGGISINSEDNTLLNAGIDFAYSSKDAVTPFSRYIGAGKNIKTKLIVIIKIY